MEFYTYSRFHKVSQGFLELNIQIFYMYHQKEPLLAMPWKCRITQVQILVQKFKSHSN